MSMPEAARLSGGFFACPGGIRGADKWKITVADDGKMCYNVL